MLAGKHNNACPHGERGIRTPVRYYPEIVFETTAFNHSAISPKCQKALRYFTEIWGILTTIYHKVLLRFTLLLAVTNPVWGVQVIVPSFLMS